MTPDMANADYVYVGTAKCGCIVFFACDFRGKREITGEIVLDFVDSGLAVSRIPLLELTQRWKSGVVHGPQCSARAPEVSTKTQLARCPFCGENSTGYVYSTERINDSDDSSYYILCVACGARGGRSRTTTEAIERWNTRTSQ